MSTSQLEKFQDDCSYSRWSYSYTKKHMLSFVGPLGKTYKSFRKIPINVEISQKIKFYLTTIDYQKNEIMQYYILQDQ